MSRFGLALVSIGAGIAVFGFRLLSLQDLSNDHYTYLAWAQQLLAGNLPGRDFVDAGMPLAYGLSALAQLAHPGPFTEGVLTTTMLGIAAGVTCLVVGRMTGSIAAGLGAAVIEAALMPRLYSFPKILVPVVALALLQWYAVAPSRLRLATLALWTVLGALLRYDLGLYAGIAITVGLLTAHWREWGRAARAVGVYIGAGVVVGLPYAAYVQWAEGIAEHLHGTIEYTKSETNARAYGWPGFPALEAGGIAEWSVLDSSAFIFYAIRMLALIPIILLLLRRRRLEKPEVAVVVAATTLLWLYQVLILRHPIEQRIQDFAAVLAVTGGWTAVTGGRLAWEWLAGPQGGRRLAGVATAAAIVVVTAGVAVSAWRLNNLGEHLSETRVDEGPAEMRERLAAIAEEGTVWPWPEFWPTGELPDAVEYLRRCTRDTDRLMLTWSAPEYYYFSGRPFAAGHALVLPPRAFINPRDQNRMLRFLERGRVPIVLINETRREEFARAYPQVDAYLRNHYVGEGHFTIYDDSEITIATRKQLTPTGTWGEHGWPCGM